MGWSLCNGQRNWFELAGEAVILMSSVMGVLRSDQLEKLPATREAGRNKDGKLQENRAWAAGKCVTSRNNLKQVKHVKEERLLFTHLCFLSVPTSHFHYCCGQLHMKICFTYQMTKSGKPWMLTIDLRLTTKPWKFRNFWSCWMIADAGGGVQWTWHPPCSNSLSWPSSGEGGMS